MQDVSSKQDDETLLRDCRRAAQQFTVRYGWQLVTEDELVKMTLSALAQGSSSDVYRAVITQYTTILYYACLGDRGVGLQEQAYAELARYLYQLVRLRFPDVAVYAAEDIIAATMERVYAHITRCRAPAAFLAFAAQYLLDSVRVARRATTRETLLSSFKEDEYVFASADVIDSHLQKNEMLQALSDAIKQLPLRDQQLLLLKYVEGLSDDEISKRLGIPVNQIRVLRNRVRHKLRLNSTLREYLEED